MALPISVVYSYTITYHPRTDTSSRPQDVGSSGTKDVRISGHQDIRTSRHQNTARRRFLKLFSIQVNGQWSMVHPSAASLLKLFSTLVNGQWSMVQPSAASLFKPQPQASSSRLAYRTSPLSPNIVNHSVKINHKKPKSQRANISIRQDQ